MKTPDPFAIDEREICRTIVSIVREKHEQLGQLLSIFLRASRTTDDVELNRRVFGFLQFDFQFW